jgi:hypothetical protein
MMERGSRVRHVVAADEHLLQEHPDEVFTLIDSAYNKPIEEVGQFVLTNSSSGHAVRRVWELRIFVFVNGVTQREIGLTSF